MDDRNDADEALEESAARAPQTPEQQEHVSARVAPPPGPPRWMSAIAEPHNALPILIIMTVALYMVNLGGYPLYTKGEPREAVTVYNIVHGGGVILPQRAGVEIPSKPLL